MWTPRDNNKNRVKVDGLQHEAKGLNDKKAHRKEIRVEGLPLEIGCETLLSETDYGITEQPIQIIAMLLNPSLKYQLRL